MDFLEGGIDARPDGSSVKLVYVDLYFAPPVQQHEQLAAIWKLLELEPSESTRVQYYLQPEGVKVNSAATYGMLPNAAEIQRLCRNDETGWLYE
jgi:hypothetical protein